MRTAVELRMLGVQKSDISIPSRSSIHIFFQSSLFFRNYAINLTTTLSLNIDIAFVLLVHQIIRSKDALSIALRSRCFGQPHCS